MNSISTHILDTALGLPAKDVKLQLSRLENNQWQTLGSASTNDDGRAPDLLEKGTELPAGTYKMLFETAAYFSQNQNEVFYPFVEVVFNISKNGGHYHIPLLLSPYGYSTYRGS